VFFFLSKTIGYLTQPAVLVGLLFVAAWIIRAARWRRTLLLSGIILFFLFGNDFLSNELMRWWELPPQPLHTFEKTYEYGIVLTGITKAQTGPPDRVYFSRGADRATQAIQLYHRGTIRRIVISGGVGRLMDVGHREGQALKEFMVLCGVDSAHIILEGASDNTAESAAAVSQMLASTPASACLLITSAFHQRRALACFKKQGWLPDYFSADPLARERRFTPDVLLIPDLDAWMNWHTLFKEWAGMAMYRAAGYL
jgi:uncharacterized SAM-binding protein YcdF (DUF218 family)